MFGIILFTVLIIVATKHIVRQYREDNGTKYKSMIIYSEQNKSKSKSFQIQHQNSYIGENNNSNINKVRIEIEMTEHKYWATDDDYGFLDIFILDGTDGYYEMKIYVDGELIDFDDTILEEYFSDKGNYEKLEEWENLDNLGYVGYHDNTAYRVWEFEVEEFDPSKLSLYWECYDMYFGLSDYEKEDRMLELRYDDEYVSENTDEYDWDEGDFFHIWPLDDDENESYRKKKEKMKKDSATAVAYMLLNS